MADVEKFVDGDGRYDYLARSIAIVTLLYELGILSELIESGQITEEEIAARAELIKQRYPAFSADSVGRADSAQRTADSEKKKKIAYSVQRAADSEKPKKRKKRQKE